MCCVSLPVRARYLVPHRIRRQESDGIRRSPVDNMRMHHNLMRKLSRREVSKNETFWHDSDPWRIFSTSSRGLWIFPGALTYIYGIPTSFVVEPACATVTNPQSEV